MSFLTFFEDVFRKLKAGTVVGEGSGTYVVEFLDREVFRVSAPNVDGVRSHLNAVGKKKDIFSIRKVK